MKTIAQPKETMKLMKIGVVATRCAAGVAACVALLAGTARASTTILAGGTFTIDGTNTTLAGFTTTWNDTGTLTINNGGILQTWPSQNNTVANNDAIAFAGAGGTYSLRYNGNDTDFMMNGASITSSATGAQTLAVLTGYNGNGDRESVTFKAGIPNVGDGSALTLNVTFRCQTGSQSWVNLNAVNTFTGPITLVAGGGPATGYLTIGGTLTRNNGTTFSAGTLNSGNYAGAITLGASTIFNYASTSAQSLSGAISGTGALQVTGTGALTLSGVNTYTGNTTINSGSMLTLANTPAGLKFVVTDTTNNKVTGAGNATINGTFTIDTSAVTVTSGTWTLVDATTKSFGGTFGLNGFTGLVGNVYTKVNGGQTWTFDKSTGVLSLSTQAIITAFGLPGNAGTINQTAKTIALTVPYGTNLATLAPTFTLTSGSCNQISGSLPSPTFAASNPAHYIVTGSVVNDYAVTVSVTPASTNRDILTFGLPGNAGVINGTNITLTVPVSPGVTNLAPTYTVSQFATGSPVSGTALNFTSPQTYRITAQDGSTKDYLVTVQTYQAWPYSGSFYILTDATGANLPGTATESEFPILVRLNSSNFPFAQAASDGKDIRFSTAAGMRLFYQIEQWDFANSTAAVWVRIPTITCNARQEIKMYWGKTDAVSESSGTAVFDGTNGFLSVFHMNETVKDEVGTLTPTDTGTTLATGMIGKGRNFTLGKGINCGENITAFPTGNSPSSTEAWFRLSSGNAEIVDWGTEGGGNKVQIRLVSPPSIYIDGNGASFYGKSTLPFGKWYHVAHTYTSGSGKIYVNGQPDGSAGVTMNFANPAKMWIGGWYNNYSCVGDIDEVRISKVARSANWINLEYQNQNPVQTLVGPLVQPGSTYSVAPTSVTMDEGAVTNLVGQAGGAQKIYWIYKKDGVETVLATDQFTYPLSIARCTGTQSFDILFRAVFSSTDVKNIYIPVTVNEHIPDPVFTLTGPATWDGRQTITITPNISNLATLNTMGIANLTYSWNVAGVAVTKTITAGTPTVPGTLTLTRSQGTGPMTVTLVLDNGGALVTQTKTITVQEPVTDAWVQRTPGATEKTVNNQFIARDPNTNMGTIFYNGTGAGTTPVYLKIYATPNAGTETQYGQTLHQTPVAGAYAFTTQIAAGKVTYRLEFGTTTGGVDSAPTGTATNLVCGDAYLIDGQSNALATDNTAPNDTTTDPWIRTYGLSGGWGYAISKGTEMQLGLWGWYLAKSMTATYNMPVCFIQGAVGGTRIDQHQPNPAGHNQPGSLYSIYANIYNRVIGGNLSHGIRGVFWHQGENNSGAAAPTGDYDYKSYQQYFVDMAAAWKGDFPNLQRYIIYQVMPSPCSMGPKGDQLRDVQRILPSLFSKMHILDTLGVPGYEGCHFSPTGYQNFADLTAPLVSQDFYGIVPGMSVTAPILQLAYFTNAARTEIALQFDQNMSWNSFSTANYWLDKVGSKVTSGSVSGNVVKLQLSSAGTTTSTLDYLEDTHWSYGETTSSLLYGANGIGALTFADVAIAPSSPYYSWTADSAQGLTAGVNDGPMDDPDHDGICNLLEFALGGAPMVASRTRLPVSSQTGGNLIFEYDRSVASRPPNTTQIVEYGGNLTGWTQVAIPLNSSGSVTITLGSTSDHVKVIVPVSGAKVFARLRVITN